ncbi:GPW/gp25 family protein, partial [Escherichia coli]
MTSARYRGMNAETGETLTDNEHISQSINDILLTPVGSRVMRRAYGSQLNNLIDQPGNAVTRLRIMSAIYSALFLWEPRISLTNIVLTETGAGQMIATIKASRTDTQSPFTTDVT